MTDGTSQGLFIVVAIVIFGIFVVMAYILFEDTLSPALASMFTTATEQSAERLTPTYTDESYFVFDTTSRTITKYVGPPTAVIKIPKTINGRTVEKIGYKAFDPDVNPTASEIKEVYLPENLTHVGNSAFDNIFGMEKVVFGSKVEYIGQAAFQNGKFTVLELPKTLKKIDTSAFRDSLITEVTLSRDTVYESNSFPAGITIHIR